VVVAMPTSSSVPTDQRSSSGSSGAALFLGTPSRLPHAQVGDWVSHSMVSADRSFGVCCAAGGPLNEALQDTTSIGLILTVICVSVIFLLPFLVAKTMAHFLIDSHWIGPTVVVTILGIIVIWAAFPSRRGYTARARLEKRLSARADGLRWASFSKQLRSPQCRGCFVFRLTLLRFCLSRLIRRQQMACKELSWRM
jgi:hypothetical protein